VRLTAAYRLADGTVMPSVWDRLLEALNRTWPHASGVEMRIQQMAIDSGWATQEVYDWVRRSHDQRVIIVKGQNTGKALLGQPVPCDVNFRGKKITHGVKFRPLNVSEAKHQLYGRLQLDPPTTESGEPYPPGYCHFPKMNEDFFKQLTAEVLETITDRAGYRVQKWVKHGRNEVLDTKNYARAAAYNLGADWAKEKWWREWERSLGLREASVAGVPALSPASPEDSATPIQAAEASPAKPAVQPSMASLRPRRSRMIPPSWQL
jgi:phage terminase large subunit GpA-like protein